MNSRPEALADAHNEDALHGVRVLDLTRFLSGPYCTMMLADAGAEVIKVEPQGGELNRSLPNLMTTEEGAVFSTYFLRHNRGKKSVVLDIRSDADRPAFEELIRSVDVLVENFRPGAMASWGYSWERLQELNPRLTYASISGFGHTETEYTNRPAFNLVAEAMAGVVSRQPRDGERPRAAGLPFGDSITSVYTVAAISMALVKRHRTGRGSRVDMSMYDAMVAMNEWSIAIKSTLDLDLHIGSEHHQWFAPYSFFQANDGWMAICIITDAQWEKFCHLAGFLDLLGDPRLATGEGRAALVQDVIEPRINDWLADQSRQVAVDRLTAAGIPAAPLNTPQEVLESDLAATREMIAELDIDPSTKGRFAGNPIRVEPRSQAHATGFAHPGEHNEEILRGLRVEMDAR